MPPTDVTAAPYRRAVTVATLTVLALLMAAAVTIPLVGRLQLQYTSIFYEQFAAIEPFGIAVVALFAALVLAVLCGSRARGDVAPLLGDPVPAAFRWPLPRLTTGTGVIALGVFVIVAVGIHVVFHQFFLADDEYSAWFQAVIFAHGHREAVVAPQWCPWVAGLTPTSIVADGCSWRLNFLPIHSLLRSSFIALRLDQFAGPSIAAISVGLVAAIARKAWPTRTERAWIAALVLGTSTQVLFMSMTMFAMQTHLLFSLIWLWLYIDNRGWSVAALPWVGFLALGVHSPVPHALFVPPFLLRYLRNRRFGVAAYVAAVYAVAVMFWARQLGAHAMASAVGAAALASPSATAGLARSLIAIPSALQSVTVAMHLALVMTWNTPLASVAVICALMMWKRLDAFGSDLALSLILVLAVRAFDPGGAFSQGEGWGYRYIYANLGNFALLAACGTDVLVAALGARRSALLWAASLATSLAVQFPMRGVQVQRIIRPYYLASSWMASLPAKIVVFPADAVLWGRQLVRNDPFLQRGNKLIDVYDIKPADLNELQRLNPGQVRVVTAHELYQFGLEPQPIRIGSITVIPH